LVREWVMKSYQGAKWKNLIGLPPARDKLPCFKESRSQLEVLLSMRGMWSCSIGLS
jgi:hypothetical protein